MHGKEGVVGGRRAGVGGRLARLVWEKISSLGKHQTVVSRVSFSSCRNYGAQSHVFYTVRSLLRAHQAPFAYPCAHRAWTVIRSHTKTR